jgi:hypothetical protein
LLEVEQVRAEAGMALLKIAGAIKETESERVRAAMKRLLGVCKDEDLIRRAKEILRETEELKDKTGQ